MQAERRPGCKEAMQSDPTYGGAAVTFNDILQEKILVSHAALEGEHKQVTVLWRLRWPQ